MTIRPQCQRQVGVRPTTIYNAVTVPKIVLCPHFATSENGKWCADHEAEGEAAVAQLAACLAGS